MTYSHCYEWILNIIEQADQKVKNPSRSIRFPGAIRPEKNKVQELRYMGKRISQDELASWLNQWPDKKPKIPQKMKVSETPDFERIGNWCIKAIKEGVDQGRRNQQWMSIGCEFAIAGYDLDTTLAYLQKHFVEERDFKFKEWKTAVSSGHRYAQRNLV